MESAGLSLNPPRKTMQVYPNLEHQQQIHADQQQPAIARHEHPRWMDEEQSKRLPSIEGMLRGSDAIPGSNDSNVASYPRENRSQSISSFTQSPQSPSIGFWGVPAQSQHNNNRHNQNNFQSGPSFDNASPKLNTSFHPTYSNNHDSSVPNHISQTSRAPPLSPSRTSATQYDHSHTRFGLSAHEEHNQHSEILHDAYGRKVSGTPYPPHLSISTRLPINTGMANQYGPHSRLSTDTLNSRQDGPSYASSTPRHEFGPPSSRTSNTYRTSIVSQSEEAAAATTLASLPNTPSSPFHSDMPPMRPSYARTAEGSPLLPGQHKHDERSMDLRTMLNNGDLLPHLPRSLHGGSNPASVAVNSNDGSAASSSYECNGRTGLRSTQVPDWPTPQSNAQRRYTEPRILATSSHISFGNPGINPRKRAAPELQADAPKKPKANPFVFIDSNDAEAPKKVRQHVMRRHRAEERKATEAQNEAEGAKHPHTAPSNLLPQKKKSARKPQPKNPKKTKLKVETEEPNPMTASLVATSEEMRITKEAEPRDIPASLVPISPKSLVSSASSVVASKSPSESDSRENDLFTSFARALAGFSGSASEKESWYSVMDRKDPYSAVAATLADPFNKKLAAILDLNQKPGQVEYAALLHHLAWVMPNLMDDVVSGTPFNRPGWLFSKIAILDDEPLPAIVGYTACHIASLRGAPEPAWAIEKKSEAIRLINERLNNPATQKSDGNIGAVLLLLAFEIIFCNPQVSAAHMGGLRKMIQSRPGGHLSLDTNEALHSGVLRLEIVRAYLTISEHRFHAWKPLKKLGDFMVHIGPLTDSAIYSQTYKHRFCSDGLRLINRVEAALLHLQNLSVSGVKLNRDDIRKTVSACIRGALALDEDPPSKWGYHINRKVIRLACIIMLDLAAKEFFDTGASYAKPKTFINRFARRLLGYETDPQRAAVWGRSVHMVLTSLIQASATERGKPWRGLYFADLLLITMELGKDEWLAVEHAIMDYVQNWGWCELHEFRNSFEYFNLQGEVKAFRNSWVEWKKTKQNSLIPMQY